jgi:hypothetical protein
LIIPNGAGGSSFAASGVSIITVNVFSDLGTTR